MKNLFDIQISDADVKVANRIRKRVQRRYPNPVDMFEDLARRDPGAYALIQHYFKDASVQDKDTALMVMVEACASMWALVRELRFEARERERLN